MTAYLTASQNKWLSEQSAESLALNTATELSISREPLWEWLFSKISENVAKGYYSLTIDQNQILKFTKNTSEVSSTLGEMGYKVDYSCSSNPDNERWFISWK